MKKIAKKSQKKILIKTLSIFAIVSFCLLLLLIIIISIESGEDDHYLVFSELGGSNYNEEIALTEQSSSEPILTFELVAGEAGEYGKLVTYNKGTEFEKTFYAYYVPASVYTVTNVGEYMGQICIYSGETYITEEGWEEPAESFGVELLDVDETTTITVKDGQYIEIQAPDEFCFKAQ
ncbi:hypothetical protein [Harryflintia acetispora]|uniref:Uncharacterized protein n=1 Tax=Harryflintia acetispora TaxID=1849041 RepID=A0A9X8UKG6_9FIRM|nr:hypothetical protein [Harryflintia acetispora]TCL44462.1 hypothetical protein EDD78_10280 [Harryflintia acetispora]